MENCKCNEYKELLDIQNSKITSLEYEIDDLLGYNVPKEYIFTFSTIISDGNPMVWQNDIFPSILRKLNKFIPELNRDNWPTTGEVSEFVPYKDFVRKIKNKKFGTRFIKISND